MTKTKQVSEEIDWNLGTWKGARQEQLKRWSRLSLKEIILAQEEMQKITAELHENNPD